MPSPPLSTIFRTRADHLADLFNREDAAHLARLDELAAADRRMEASIEPDDDEDDSDVEIDD